MIIINWIVIGLLNTQISNNQLLIYEEPEEGNPTSVYEIKELTKNKLVLLYKKVDDNDGYKAEITTTFEKNLIRISTTTEDRLVQDFFAQSLSFILFIPLIILSL